MSQTPRQKLRQAIREWLLSELGVTDQLTAIEEAWMTKFHEYVTAVNQTLAVILDKVAEQKVLTEKLLKASVDEDEALFAEAKTALAENQQRVVDAIAGIATNVPSPVVPTPVVSVSVDDVTKIPDLIIPSVPGEGAAPAINPDVPVTITPSPDGVGVDGGSNISVSADESEI